jgi:hypothetical protein
MELDKAALDRWITQGQNCIIPEHHYEAMELANQLYSDDGGQNDLYDASDETIFKYEELAMKKLEARDEANACYDTK